MVRLHGFARADRSCGPPPRLGRFVESLPRYGYQSPPRLAGAPARRLAPHAPANRAHSRKRRLPDLSMELVSNGWGAGCLRPGLARARDTPTAQFLAAISSYIRRL